MNLGKTSEVFHKNLDAFLNPQIGCIVNKGGTRSGKTYSILQLLAFVAWNSTKPLVISVVTQTFPQLRAGAMRDFQKIIGDEGDFEENKSSHEFRINKSIVEFFSADQYLKVLGGQRDILFINECFRLNYEVVRQLMVRTAWKKIFDYNPVANFWMNDKILTREDAFLITSTYQDNKEFLSPAQIAEIESHKNDTNWWRVYGLGQEGRVEGLVFPDWDRVESMPAECKVRYGIDFGYNDPSTLIKVGVTGQDLYLQEVIYKRGIVTDDMDILLEQNGLQRRKDRIIYDSAAREQGETLFRRGWNMHPSQKGGGSILAGISAMKKYKMHIVQPSPNLEQELLNYMWEKDKNDNTLDVPIDGFNHLLDPARYALKDLESKTGNYAISYI